MINYRYEEEKITALLVADILDDALAKEIINKGCVSNKEEARHLSQFFWRMVNKAAESDIDLPCEGSVQYWTEKLYNSFGGYLEKSGYEELWDEEIDKA